MSGWLTALGPEGTALSLLLLGHVIGDFVFQTDDLARAKHRFGPLLAHTGIVVVVHAVAVVPVLTPQAAILVAVIGATHLVIDAVSARLRRHRTGSVALFLGDQAAHLLVILAGWALIEPSTWTTAPVVTALGGTETVPWSALTTGAVYAAAFAFADVGGNTIVRGVLPDDGPTSREAEGGDDGTDDLEAGSLIGTLERWIILLLGLAGRWESVALVVAAKSIARFEELKKRPFAEYFLVGTLASVLVAMGLVVLVSVLV